MHKTPLAQRREEKPPVIPSGGAAHCLPAFQERTGLIQTPAAKNAAPNRLAVCKVINIEVGMKSGPSNPWPKANPPTNLPPVNKLLSSNPVSPELMVLSAACPGVCLLGLPCDWNQLHALG